MAKAHAKLVTSFSNTPNWSKRKRHRRHRSLSQSRSRLTHIRHELGTLGEVSSRGRKRLVAGRRPHRQEKDHRHKMELGP